MVKEKTAIFFEDNGKICSGQIGANRNKKVVQTAKWCWDNREIKSAQINQAFDFRKVYLTPGASH